MADKKAKEVQQIQSYLQRGKEMRAADRAELKELMVLDRSGIVEVAQVAVEGWNTRMAEVHSGFFRNLDFANLVLD